MQSKLDITHEEYLKIFNNKILSFKDYKTLYWLVSKLKKLVHYLRNKNLSK